MQWILIALTVTLSFVAAAAAVLYWIGRPDFLADERDAEIGLIRAVAKRR